MPTPIQFNLVSIENISRQLIPIVNKNPNTNPANTFLGPSASIIYLRPNKRIEIAQQYTDQAQLEQLEIKKLIKVTVKLISAELFEHNEIPPPVDVNPFPARLNGLEWWISARQDGFTNNQEIVYIPDHCERTGLTSHNAVMLVNPTTFGKNPVFKTSLSDGQPAYLFDTQQTIVTQGGIVGLSNFISNGFSGLTRNTPATQFCIWAAVQLATPAVNGDFVIGSLLNEPGNIVVGTRHLLIMSVSSGVATIKLAISSPSLVAVSHVLTNGKALICAQCDNGVCDLLIRSIGLQTLVTGTTSIVNINPWVVGTGGQGIQSARLYEVFGAARVFPQSVRQDGLNFLEEIYPSLAN